MITRCIYCYILFISPDFNNNLSKMLNFLSIFITRMTTVRSGISGGAVTRLGLKLPCDYLCNCTIDESGASET